MTFLKRLGIHDPSWQAMCDWLAALRNELREQGLTVSFAYGSPDGSRLVCVTVLRDGRAIGTASAADPFHAAELALHAAALNTAPEEPVPDTLPSPT